MKTWNNNNNKTLLGNSKLLKYTKQINKKITNRTKAKQQLRDADTCSKISLKQGEQHNLCSLIAVSICLGETVFVCRIAMKNTGRINDSISQRFWKKLSKPAQSPKAPQSSFRSMSGVVSKCEVTVHHQSKRHAAWPSQHYNWETAQGRMWSCGAEHSIVQLLPLSCSPLITDHVETCGQYKSHS